MLQEIDSIYAHAKALESAAEVAAVLAVRAGASERQVSETLHKATRQVREPNGTDRLEVARCHLEGRRVICRAVTTLALSQGLDPEALMQQLKEAGEGSARLHYAVTPADLGL